MKETRLGEFEEVILLLVGILGEDAYAFKIAEEFESQTARAVSIGAVHSTLNRLESKGFLRGTGWKTKADLHHYSIWTAGVEGVARLQGFALEPVPGICW